MLGIVMIIQLDSIIGLEMIYWVNILHLLLSNILYVDYC